jgi:hypothetical protein
MTDIKRPVGRPSKYSPAYCDEIIAAGEQGLSLTAAAGIIGVARSTINEWMDEYPDFSEACKKAQSKRTLFLEKGMIDPAATGPMVTARRFALANAAPEEWREKVTQEHTGPGGEALVFQTIIEARK